MGQELVQDRVGHVQSLLGSVIWPHVDRVGEGKQQAMSDGSAYGSDKRTGRAVQGCEKANGRARTSKQRLEGDKDGLHRVHSRPLLL